MRLPAQLPCLLSLLLLLVSGPALASRDDPHVTVIGLIGSKAILRIEGDKHMLAAGESAGAVTVVEVTRQDALLRINGRERRLGMGMDTGPISARAAGASIEVVMNGNGQFIATGQINGRNADFLIDTGANLVSMTTEDARALGIDYLRLGQPGQTQTAGGTVRSWQVVLERVKLGPIELRGVIANVREAPRVSPILLGMTFLSRVNLQQEQNRLRLSER